MALICTGYNCPKSKECGKCINNLNSRYHAEVNTVENLASFGSFTFDGTGVHYHNNVLCGTNGNYAMFELVRDSSDIVDDGRLSVDYYMKQAERRLNSEKIT